MRFKTSHQLLLIGLALFLGAVLLNAVLLKREFEKINLDDAMRSFEKFPLDSFDRAYLETGVFSDKNESASSINVEIRQGEKPMLYIIKGLKDSMQWRVKEGALQLKGYSSRHQSRQRAMLVIDCPNLKFLETQASELNINAYRTDSIVLRCLKGSQVVLQNVHFQKAHFEVAGNSGLNVEKGSEIQHLHLDIKDRSSVNLTDLLPVSFTKLLDPEASIALKGKALALFK